MCGGSRNRSNVIRHVGTGHCKSKRDKRNRFYRKCIQLQKRLYRYHTIAPCGGGFLGALVCALPRLAPVIEGLASKYGDKVDFYKMNIDDNQQVAQDLRISSIPLVVFFPAGSLPFKGAVGVQPTEVYENAIKEMIAQQEADSSAQ